jgi:dihydroneopterin aldolase
LADSIQLLGIQVSAALGVTQEERNLRRPVEIDLELQCDLCSSAASDELRDTLDYVAVFELVARVAGCEHRLVEALAERICSALFAAFPRIEEVRIEARKIAPLPGAVRTAGVKLVRRRAPE